MIKVTIEDKFQWVIVVLFNGDSYGNDNCLTYEDDQPTVEFYDTRHQMDKDPEGNLIGQFVSRYYMSSLLGHESGMGLNLDGGVPDWSISGEGMRQIQEFLTTDYRLLKYNKNKKPVKTYHDQKLRCIDMINIQFKSLVNIGRFGDITFNNCEELHIDEFDPKTNLNHFLLLIREMNDENMNVFIDYLNRQCGYYEQKLTSFADIMKKHNIQKYLWEAYLKLMEYKGLM